MFSLIITVISIALVAALALATLYYGGAAFSSGSTLAEASKVILQGQQLLGAADMYFTDNRVWPATIQDLVTGNYLKQIPNAAIGVSDAFAATGWTMPVPGSPMFVAATANSGVCADVNNGTALRQKGILTKAFTGLIVQCYGSAPANLTTIFRKSSDISLLGAVPAANIIVGAPPTDLTSALWLVAPAAAISSVNNLQYLNVAPATFSFPPTAMFQFVDVALGPVISNTAPAGGPTITLFDAWQTMTNFYAYMGADCQTLGLKLAPGQSCHLAGGFQPVAVGTPLTDVYVLKSSAGNVNVAMSGNGLFGTPPLPDYNLALNFRAIMFDGQPGTTLGGVLHGPVVAPGGSSSLVVTLANNDTIPVPMPILSWASLKEGLSFSHSCTTIPVGGNCPVTFTFAPTVPTSSVENLLFTGARVNTNLFVNVSGQTAPPTGPLSFTSSNRIETAPGSGDFAVGTVSKGVPFQVLGTYTNTSGFAMKVTSQAAAVDLAGASSNASTSVLTNCPVGTTLANGATCSVTWTVTPTAVGPFTAWLITNLNGFGFGLMTDGTAQ